MLLTMILKWWEIRRRNKVIVKYADQEGGARELYSWKKFLSEKLGMNQNSWANIKGIIKRI